MLGPTSGRSSPCRAARTRSPCGTCCSSSGTRPTGCTSGLGIGDYSDASGEYARGVRVDRGACTLLEVDLPTDHGFDIPTAAKAARRVPCSACGLSKRHLFDEAARDGGYDVVVTGHNLDDEAAVLFGNVLHWQTDYLGRQLPVLPGPQRVPPQGQAAGAPRRAGDGGLLRAPRHRLHRRGVPDGRRATSTSATRRRSTRSRRPRRARSTTSTSGSSRGRPSASPRRRRPSRRELQACARCGAPTTGEVCAFCRLVERATAGAGGRWDARSRSDEPGLLGGASRCCSSTRRSGATCSRSTAGKEFHSHSGTVGPRRRDRRRRRAPRSGPATGCTTWRSGPRWPTSCSRCRAARR